MVFWFSYIYCNNHYLHYKAIKVMKRLFVGSDVTSKDLLLVQLLVMCCGKRNDLHFPDWVSGCQDRYLLDSESYASLIVQLIQSQLYNILCLSIGDCCNV